MAVDLYDHVPSLLREVNPPGTNVFSSVSEDDMVGYLSDAFWEASLDGFVQDWTCDEDGQIKPLEVGGEELPRSQVSLIVLYAGIRVLRNRILNMNTQFAAKAGPVEFEQQNSATMLVEQLKQLRATKERLLDKVESGVSLDMAVDALSVRTYSHLSYWGGPELTGI
jgi:hypothetical protein